MIQEIKNSASVFLRVMPLFIDSFPFHWQNLKKIQEMDKEASDESSTDLDELKNADWVRQQWNSDSASLLVVYFLYKA